MCAMNCLIGVCDSDVNLSVSLSPFCNKIGGSPDCPEKIKLQLPVCKECGKTQVLVVQLYCCLGKSAYHRSLYLFACINPTCWNKSESWTAYRCQSLSSETCEGPAKGVEVGLAGEDSDGNDWGTRDSWGVDSDDWGGDADDLSNLVKDSEQKTAVVPSKETERGTMATDEKMASCHDEMQKLAIDVSDDANYDASNSSIDVSDDANIDACDANIDACDVVMDDDDHDVDASVKAQILAEDLPTLSEEEKLEALNKLQSSRKTEATGIHELKSYYISVFEEPTNEEYDSGHVTKLLSEYQKTEGCNVEDLIDATGGKEKGKGEKYERSSLLHKDVVFHKFLKRVSRCPEQCIRYEWNGYPLFISAPKSSLPVECHHCGGPVVFELQLMPALVNHLKLPDDMGTVLEFGTVLVYTCQQSCWNDTDLYRTEHVLVQSDPDEYLFK